MLSCFAAACYLRATALAIGCTTTGPPPDLSCAGARCTVFCALSRAALDAHAGPEGCYFDSDCLPHRPSRRALQVRPVAMLHPGFPTPTPTLMLTRLITLSLNMNPTQCHSGKMPMLQKSDAEVGVLQCS